MLAYALFAVDPADQKPDENAQTLVEGLNTADLDGRRDLASALAALGKMAVPRTAEALRMGRTEMKRGAIDALRQMGPDAADGVPALIEELQDPQSLVKGETIYCLLSIGPAAKAAGPALEAIIKNCPDNLKEGAKKALDIISPNRQPSTEEF